MLADGKSGLYAVVQETMSNAHAASSSMSQGPAESACSHVGGQEVTGIGPSYHNTVQKKLVVVVPHEDDPTEQSVRKNVVSGKLINLWEVNVHSLAQSR